MRNPIFQKTYRVGLYLMSDESFEILLVIRTEEIRNMELDFSELHFEHLEIVARENALLNTSVIE